MAKPEEKKPLALREKKFKGYTAKEFKNISDEELQRILPASIRRRMKRGLGRNLEHILKKCEKIEKAGLKGEKVIRTHCRNAFVLPKMLGHTFGVYNGIEFLEFSADIDKIGCYFG